MNNESILCVLVACISSHAFLFIINAFIMFMKVLLDFIKDDEKTTTPLAPGKY